jgi:ABC-type Mn2+/Zn2+ transport system permease subunit
MAPPTLYSIALSLLTALAAGLVGAFALMRRMALAGDVMSHIALPGLGLALLFHINPIIGGAASLLVGVVLIWRLQELSSLTTEVSIGVIFTAALAIGTLLTPSDDLMEALFGRFQDLSLAWFLAGAASVLLIVWFIYYFRHKLILSLFSTDLAAAAGINLSRLNLYYLLIFGLTVLLGLRFLGALLVGALIILPAAAGRQLASTLGGFLAASSIVSFISVGLGLLLYYQAPILNVGSVTIHLEPGPTVIAVASVLFLVSLLNKAVRAA